MSAAVSTLVHPSCFPAHVSMHLRQCLQARVVDPKFHYTTYAQARSWRRVHEQFAPSRQENSTVHLYEQACQSVLQELRKQEFQLLGLGCGTGQKEACLLEIAGQSAEAVSYVPLDVSLPLVLEAHLAGHPWVEASRPVICDLSQARDLAEVIGEISLHGCPRIVTLFGLLPQLDPNDLFNCVRSLVQPQDQVLFSTNLIPPGPPRARLEQILVQYRNEPTHEWLMHFLRDLGVRADAGQLQWKIEEIVPDEIYRFAAWFEFGQKVEFEAGGEDFLFAPGQRLLLFFSYRYTSEGVAHFLTRLRPPARPGQKLAGPALILENSWRSASGEEGIYHLRAAGG